MIRDLLEASTGFIWGIRRLIIITHGANAPVLSHLGDQKQE